MGDFLQLVGSIASILGVPLAVYLYLRGQVQKYATVRREIVKRLSHQIGEGRTVGLFELNAVIDSLARENRLKTRSISPNSVIEDLIAETVSSPLLESSRKEQLIKELGEVHSLGVVYQAISSDADTFSEFIQHLGAQTDTTDEAEKIRGEIETAKEKSGETSKTPEQFAWISGVLASLGVAASLATVSEGIDLIPKILDSEIISSLFLGMVASVLAAFIIFVINQYGSKK